MLDLAWLKLPLAPKLDTRRLCPCFYVAAGHRGPVVVKGTVASVEQRGKWNSISADGLAQNERERDELPSGES